MLGELNAMDNDRDDRENALGERFLMDNESPQGMSLDKSELPQVSNSQGYIGGKDMLRDFDGMVAYCIEHGGSLKSHRGFGEWVRRVRGEIEISGEDMEVVEYGLRLVVAEAYNLACNARTERAFPKTIAWFDRAYEKVLETYRRVTGKEPTALSARRG